MDNPHKPTLRIDWFDGTLIEDTILNSGPHTSQFADEEQIDQREQPEQRKPIKYEKKPIGFRKLLELSSQNSSILTLELTHKDSFWMLMNAELKDDYIVLIVKIMAKLYKSLESDETSLLKTALRSKFVSSKFISSLKQYLSTLPHVRVVEKQMNSQLWDDAESFYFNALAVCQGMFTFSEEGESIKNVLELLEITEASANGVREEHSERFSTELFNKITFLKSNIMEILNKVPQCNNQDISKEELNVQNNCHFKSLNIFPDKSDLTQNQVKIKPNIINGAYQNVEEYLDLQFKLLREDCFGPLREGICSYLENPSRRRFEHIRVHPKVRIIRTFVSNNKVGHLVDLAWEDRSTQTSADKRQYALSKQLMFGSLLLFTSDGFDTILCATVLDSNLDLLSDGYLAVSFQSPVSRSIFAEAYVMVESTVFFEPYHRVLKVLQNSSIDDLPMRKYIVDVKPDTSPPAYLSSETVYTLQQDGKAEISFPVLDGLKWPSSDVFGLDDSQMEAYKLALTREFAVIQGPPGTGKSYIGVKIASTLLMNLSLEGTPILIICYTNQALDQFLECIIGVTKNIVRLGTQSKSEPLQPYTLNNLRTRMKSKYSYLYASKRGELEILYKQMIEIQGGIEKCAKEIICYKSIKPYLAIDLDNSSKEDPILQWLFGNLEDTVIPNPAVQDAKEESGCNLTNIQTCFSEKWVKHELESAKGIANYVKGVDSSLKESNVKFDHYIKKIEQRLDNFKKYRNLDVGPNEKIEKNVQPYNISTETRWKLYNRAVATMKEELNNKMNTLMEQYNTCSRELDEVSTLVDGEVMRSVRVVGVTTSTAARRHDLLKRLQSPIVIVEEAAEVMEAHIVASLTYHCQHVILIGDHKQLKPSTAHYKLARHYNFEISLFERMIRNGIHARALTTQRRMRPNMAKLLVPIIYDKLENHPDVYKYADVRGMADNMFFFTHEMFEDFESSDDSWSQRNTAEAKWCVALADYLRRMKYQSQEITILTAYTGQAKLLKELTKQYTSLQETKITVVDNYQGEENRIVILSLVRSNKDGKIGFLNAINRICVALSRAKEGLYIFGNMTLLKSASCVWQFINDKLEEENAIGSNLTLCCENHKENKMKVSKLEDFTNCTSGSCLRVCKRNK